MASITRTRLVLTGLTALAAGCSPSLNWRDITPEGAAARLMFPCKPEQETRPQPGPDGRPMSVHSYSCKAQGGQYSLTWVNLGTPQEVPGALRRLRERMAALVVPGESAPVTIKGMTPDPSARQQRFSAPAGQPAQSVRQAVFARGPYIYQLLQQGPTPNDEAWDVFVSSVVLTGP
jgi:hypothetical protein